MAPWEHGGVTWFWGVKGPASSEEASSLPRSPAKQPADHLRVDGLEAIFLKPQPHAGAKAQVDAAACALGVDVTVLPSGGVGDPVELDGALA